MSEPFSTLEPDTSPGDGTSSAPSSSLGIPYITYAVIAICSVIFVYMNVAKDTSSYDRVMGILAPSCISIWSGAYWGLLTSAFVHFAFWHVLFNMWWTKDFGTMLETTLGRGRYILFIVGAAVAGSGVELAYSGQTGIGFSGVLYAMFGYGLVGRIVDSRLRSMINRQSIQWLLGWLILCMVLTAAKVWNIANGAHLGGFAFGCLVASVFTVKKYVVPSALGLAALLAVAVVSATYMPWSPYWSGREYWSDFMDAEQKAKAGDPKAQLLYSQFLVQQEGESTNAMLWLRKSTDLGYLPGMNGLAWMLATSTNESIRDGAEAVHWAERLVQRDGSKTGTYLDTLAAAYAEQGRWDDAIAAQRKAVSVLTPDDTMIKTSIVARLQLYLSHQKARE